MRKLVCKHTKKATFESKRDAEGFVQRLQHIHNDTGKLRVYECEWCNGYHLTSAPKMESKKTHLKYYNHFKKYLAA